MAINVNFDVDDADNVIDGVRYAGTSGLYELIFKRIPNDLLYTEDDINKYKSMLLATNVHKHKHHSQVQLLNNGGYKYKYVIAPLMSITSKKEKKKSGKRLPHATLSKNAIDYVHWDDPKAGGLSMIARRFASSRQQCSRQRDAVNHRGISQSRFYYKLNRVSMKRVIPARKNTLFFCTLCITHRIMKKRSDEKRKVIFERRRLGKLYAL